MGALNFFQTNVTIENSTFNNIYSEDAVNVISSNIDYILHVINHDPGYPTMPKNSPKLNDTIIQKIQCWADNGAPDN